MLLINGASCLGTPPWYMEWYALLFKDSVYNNCGSKKLIAVQLKGVFSSRTVMAYTQDMTEMWDRTRVTRTSMLRLLWMERWLRVHDSLHWLLWVFRTQPSNSAILKGTWRMRGLFIEISELLKSLVPPVCEIWPRSSFYLQYLRSSTTATGDLPVHLRSHRALPVIWNVMWVM